MKLLLYLISVDITNYTMTNLSDTSFSLTMNLHEWYELLEYEKFRDIAKDSKNIHMLAYLKTVKKKQHSGYSFFDDDDDEFASILTDSDDLFGYYTLLLEEDVQEGLNIIYQDYKPKYYHIFLKTIYFAVTKMNIEFDQMRKQNVDLFFDVLIDIQNVSDSELEILQYLYPCEYTLIYKDIKIPMTSKYIANIDYFNGQISFNTNNILELPICFNLDKMLNAIKINEKNSLNGINVSDENIYNNNALQYYHIFDYFMMLDKKKLFIQRLDKYSLNLYDL